MDFHNVYPDASCDDGEFDPEIEPDASCRKKVTTITETVILSKSVTVGRLIIKDGGMLIFKDWSRGDNPDPEGQVRTVHLRAFDIQIKKTKDCKECGNGELWIGSRRCRYNGKADISLHGKETHYSQSSSDGKLKDLHVGMKFLWAGEGSVLEIHGKEKLPWTRLHGGHIYRDNTPTDRLVFEQRYTNEARFHNDFLVKVNPKHMDRNILITI